MPNRILRDWTGSEKIEKINVHAERFFTRLIMKVDDYGCFYADTRLLKANLFPLLLDTIREADLLRWMQDCQKAGLIVIYESNNKQYLQINDFRQRLDKAKSKFPLPPKNTESLSNNIETMPETETNPETEGKGNRPTISEEEILKKQIEQMLIPEMFQIWKSKNPNYYSISQVDYPALLQIAKLIADYKKIKHASIVAENKETVLRSWRIIVDFIVSDENYLSKKDISYFANLKNWVSLTNQMQKR